MNKEASGPILGFCFWTDVYARAFSRYFDTAMASSKYVQENIDSIEFRRYKNFVSFKKDLKLILKIRIY